MFHEYFKSICYLAPIYIYFVIFFVYLGVNIGAKGKKEPAKSKKDLILEANQRKKNEKQIDSEKQMISYALMQGNDVKNILFT